MTECWTSSASSPSVERRLLDQRGGLHDQRHMPPLSRQQRQVLEGIAVNNDQIGMRSGRNHAEPALLAQQPCWHISRRRNHLVRRQRAATNDEFLRLVPVHGAEQVAA